MDRALLTILLIAIILLAAWGLLVGWRHRAQRQSDLRAATGRSGRLRRRSSPNR